MIMVLRYSLDYFIDSIHKAITVKQLNDISIEFDKLFLSGNLDLIDEDWKKFTVELNTKINLLSTPPQQATRHGSV